MKISYSLVIELIIIICCLLLSFIGGLITGQGLVLRPKELNGGVLGCKCVVTSVNQDSDKNSEAGQK